MPDQMSLSHYSDAPVLQPHAVLQLTQPTMKPRGLWVSVDGDDDWPAWCRSEEFRDTDAQHRFRVVLADDARILYLADAAALTRLTDDYGMIYDRHQWLRADSALYVMSLDWTRIAEEYQGIIIAPYQWSRRLTLTWYYGWDCASGCIWDAAAIASVDHMEVADA